MPEQSHAHATKSKTLATWIAMFGGVFGAHRFYLHGLGDRWAWLHPLPTLLGLYRISRMPAFSDGDALAWLAIPCLGLMVSYAMLCAIICALTPDERWAQRWRQPLRPTRWLPIIGAIIALLLGGTALMATVAFSGQRLFEALLTAEPSQTQ